MKKKLFLLITCFVLFSSVTVFFIYRKRQLAEIARKEEEERKRQEEEERKRQEEEQKKEKEGNQKETKEKEGNQEETDDPFYWHFILFIWKAIIFIISIFITYVIFYDIIFPGTDKTCQGCSYTKLIIFVLISFCLGVVVFPLIFAIKKYKNKSYGERFKLTAKNFAITFIVFWIVIFIIRSIHIYRLYHQFIFFI